MGINEMKIKPVAILNLIIHAKENGNEMADTALHELQILTGVNLSFCRSSSVGKSTIEITHEENKDAESA